MGGIGSDNVVVGQEELRVELGRASTSGPAWEGKELSVTSLLPPWDVSPGQLAVLCLVLKYKIKVDETRDCKGQWERMCCGKGMSRIEMKLERICKCMRTCLDAGEKPFLFVWCHNLDF